MYSPRSSVPNTSITGCDGMRFRVRDFNVRLERDHRRIFFKCFSKIYNCSYHCTVLHFFFHLLTVFSSKIHCFSFVFHFITRKMFSLFLSSFDFIRFTRRARNKCGLVLFQCQKGRLVIAALGFACSQLHTQTSLFCIFL